jgi:hypothetical protein
VSRRVSLPTADDLFRPTDDASEAQERPERRVRAVPPTADAPDESRSRRPSGRVRHDEKMTVYVTAQELLDLEHARLSLRAEHGLAVDRGRLVREALHLVLADLEQNGEASALVRRLVNEE